MNVILPTIIGATLAFTSTHFLVSNPLRDRLYKAENDLELIESRGVILRGLDDRCNDWKIRIDCKDYSTEGWDFLYVDKKEKEK